MPFTGGRVLASIKALSSANMLFAVPFIMVRYVLDECLFSRILKKVDGIFQVLPIS